MSYLKDFLTQIKNRDFHKFLVLWEEYCNSDYIESKEFAQLLKAIKESEMARHFGQIVETALPIWKTIEDRKESYEIARLLIDLQTTNTPLLVDLALEMIKSFHGEDPKFNERFKLAGLRNKENFQGAISRYDLVAHMAKSNMVFHTGGWGTGEIIEVSFVREHLVIEFENVSGRKDLSFANAFKTLIPLPHTHFLARRFSNPDQLEKEGIEDSVGLVKLLLRDLGPKTAKEIKDELCELVIKEENWVKWWGGARAKLKKDPMIESPESIKEPFYLRETERSLDEQLQSVIHAKGEIVGAIYNFLRDTPQALKNPSIKQAIENKLATLLASEELSERERLELLFLQEQFLSDARAKAKIAQIIQEEKNVERLLHLIDILAFKKRFLVAVKEERPDWLSLFAHLLFVTAQAQLRDYILRELGSSEKGRALLETKLKELLMHPARYPDMFVWYFQKLIAEEASEIPFADIEGRNQFFEAFFILFSALENNPSERDLLKKMYNLLTHKRYVFVRDLLQHTTLEFAKELLLLASKCQTLTGHDLKILHSLTEVVHPELISAKKKKDEKEGEEEIWTTEEGYLKVQDRLKQIATVEMVENAREIEAARALGDLRENSEFKFAQERRARLQSELKTLSAQLNKARILTPPDVHLGEVGVGSVVEVVDSKGTHTVYTILGPWDADVERNILAFNSKLAGAMSGKKVGESFEFRDETFRVAKVSSFFNA